MLSLKRNFLTLSCRKRWVGPKPEPDGPEFWPKPRGLYFLSVRPNGLKTLGVERRERERERERKKREREMCDLNFFFNIAMDIKCCSSIHKN